MESVKSGMKLGMTGAGDNSLRAMLAEFYNRKMLSTIILVWINALVYLALAVWSAMGFFQAETVKAQIMYAAIFVCAVQLIALIKVFAWQMIHRNMLMREIKRLESRLDEVRTGKVE